jgi:hypothetical protein
MESMANLTPSSPSNSRLPNTSIYIPPFNYYIVVFTLVLVTLGQTWRLGITHPPSRQEQAILVRFILHQLDLSSSSASTSPLSSLSSSHQTPEMRECYSLTGFEQETKQSSFLHRRDINLGNRPRLPLITRLHRRMIRPLRCTQHLNKRSIRTLEDDSRVNISLLRSGTFATLPLIIITSQHRSRRLIKRRQQLSGDSIPHILHPKKCLLINKAIL